MVNVIIEPIRIIVHNHVTIENGRKGQQLRCISVAAWLGSVQDTRNIVSIIMQPVTEITRRNRAQRPTTTTERITTTRYLALLDLSLKVRN